MCGWLVGVVRVLYGHPWPCAAAAGFAVVFKAMYEANQGVQKQAPDAAQPSGWEVLIGLLFLGGILAGAGVGWLGRAPRRR